MAKWALIAGGPLGTFSGDYDYYAGVDAGCLTLIEKNYPLVLAIGDFDSVSELECQMIERVAQEFFKAPAEKDDTDLELGLKMIFEKDPHAQVTVYGALGGRLDHTLSNVFLPSNPDLSPYMEGISLQNEQNLVCYYPQGQAKIRPNPHYSYVSFLLEGQGKLTILGAKYELTASNYFLRKIYSSNEFLAEPITVGIPDGYLIVIYSKDAS